MAKAHSASRLSPSGSTAVARSKTLIGVDLSPPWIKRAAAFCTKSNFLSVDGLASVKTGDAYSRTGLTYARYMVLKDCNRL